jgi:hypothetical protein
MSRLIRSLRRPSSKQGASRALFFLVAIITLVCATDARLTDPLWISGFYDGGDFDDLAVNVDAVSLPVCAVVLIAAEDPRAHEPREHTEAPPSLSHSTHRTRPPPTA